MTCVWRISIDIFYVKSQNKIQNIFYYFLLSIIDLCFYMVMLDFRYRKNTCYDPFDYESINQVGFLGNWGKKT